MTAIAVTKGLSRYPRENMPKLSTWIAEAAVFENALTSLPLTDPSLSSLTTGLQPI